MSVIRYSIRPEGQPQNLDAPGGIRLVGTSITSLPTAARLATENNTHSLKADLQQRLTKLRPTARDQLRRGPSIARC
jgi:hypothetical protein